MVRGSGPDGYLRMIEGETSLRQRLGEMDTRLHRQTGEMEMRVVGLLRNCMNDIYLASVGLDEACEDMDSLKQVDRGLEKRLSALEAAKC